VTSALAASVRAEGNLLPIISMQKIKQPSKFRNLELD